MDKLKKAEKINAAMKHSLKLAELANAAEGRCVCPNAGMFVWYSPDGSDPDEEPGEPPRIPALCLQCGGRQVLIKVVYDSSVTEATT
jgi:hypothetical protein